MTSIENRVRHRISAKKTPGQIGRAFRSGVSVSYIQSKHSDAVPLFVVLNRTHEVLHQEQPASTDPLTILVNTRIGNSGGIKAGSLILDFEPDVAPHEIAGNPHVLIRVLVVAVPYSIHDGFMQPVPQRERIFTRDTKVTGPVDNLVDHPPAFVNAAADVNLPLSIKHRFLISCTHNHLSTPLGLLVRPNPLIMYTHSIGQPPVSGIRHK